MSLKSRNIGLDAVRSIAILMVLVCHVFMWVSTVYKELYGEFFLNFSALSRLGWIGVEIFFVLSGFLIGKILIEEFVTNFNGSSRAALAKFYARRWFRTLPMYYLILIISIILMVTTFPGLDKTVFYRDASSYFLFLQNFFGRAELGGVYLMGVSWSLVLEEWFYLLFPLFLVILRKTTKNFSKETFFRFLIIFIIAVSILRVFYVCFMPHSFGSVTSMVFVRLDTFAVGILFAYLHCFLPGFYGFLSRKRFFIASMALIIISYFFALEFETNFLVKTVLFTVLPFSIAVFIVFLEKRVTQYSRTFELTSKVSYSLYLIHVPLLEKVLGPFMFILMAHTVKFPVFVTAMIFFVAIYIVSIGFYRYYEKPMMDLRDHKFVKNFISGPGKKEFELAQSAK